MPAVGTPPDEHRERAGVSARIPNALQSLAAALALRVRGHSIRPADAAEEQPTTQKFADGVREAERPQPGKEQLELALKELRAALDQQWDQWKHIETRLQFMLGWIATAVSLSVALGIGKSVPNDWSRVALGVAGVATLFTLWWLVQAYWPRYFFRPPEPAEFAERYLLEPVAETSLMLVDTIAEAYTLNADAIDRRTTLLARSIIASGVAGGMALLGLVLTNLGIGIQDDQLQATQPSRSEHAEPRREGLGQAARAERKGRAVPPRQEEPGPARHDGGRDDPEEAVIAAVLSLA